MSGTRKVRLAKLNRERPMCRQAIISRSLAPFPSAAEWDGFSASMSDGSRTFLSDGLIKQMARMIAEGHFKPGEPKRRNCGMTSTATKLKAAYAELRRRLNAVPEEQRTELHGLTRAYLAMAEQANYRPAASSNQITGEIILDAAELCSVEQLQHEAGEYAHNFVEQEDTCAYHIGVTDYETAQAFVFGLEALKLLCGCAPRRALKLLQMAAQDVEAALE